jgi:hypothetical protein
MVTINVLDLPIDVPDSYRLLNLLTHKANAYAEVHSLPFA